MKIRIATQGWDRSTPATELTDDTMGIKIPWVELDGHRYNDITHADIKVDAEDFTQCEITIGLIGPIQLVYVDANGEELGAKRVFPFELPDHLAHDTIIPPLD